MYYQRLQIKWDYKKRIATDLSELNWDNVVEDRSGKFLKLINSDSPVSTNMSFSTVFPIPGDE
jgi:hypothetical protein